LTDAVLIDSFGFMIRRGFLDRESREDLIDLARDGSNAHRLGRRANALVLLDNGMSCAQVARILFIDDDTVRDWHRLYLEHGVEGLAGFGYEGSECRLNEAQLTQLKGWITDVLPRSGREVGAYIATEFGVEYQSRSAIIALLHRLGMEHRRPKSIARKLDVPKQAAFIRAYETLLNQLPADEAVVFGDAVHPVHGATPVGCWAPRETRLAVPQTTRRQTANIHGALDLETGQTMMVESLSVDAASTIRLLDMIQATYRHKQVIHVFVDNARYHHAHPVDDWLRRPGCRIKLRFIPSYCPHLNPIERLWGLMHRQVTHNKCHKNLNEFVRAILGFLRKDTPEKWKSLRDAVTDNFQIVDPDKFRVLS
jgi:transposase